MVAQNKPKKRGTVIAAIVAILLGLLLSPVSRQYPIFHWILQLSPSYVGLLPALAPRPWGYTFEQLQQVDLRGQVALVTGANSGIGFEIAKALSRQGASVTLTCRNPQKCFSAVDRIRKDDGYSGAPISPLIMDVSDLSSVQRATKMFLKHNENQSLDMLYLNAGIAHSHPKWDADTLPTSKDGIESVFATNVVGHHLLYRLLEPALQNSPMARVVSTSSVASIWWLPPYGMSYRFGDTSPMIPKTLEELNESTLGFALTYALYGRSKLAQVAWTKALTRRLGDGTNIYANVAHPGAVQTPMVNESILGFVPLFLKDIASNFIANVLWTPLEGALTELYLGVATDEIRNKNLHGRYFHPQAVEFDHVYAKDEKLQDDVWKLCEELVQGFLDSSSK